MKHSLASCQGGSPQYFVMFSGRDTQQTGIYLTCRPSTSLQWRRSGAVQFISLSSGYTRRRRHATTGYQSAVCWLLSLTNSPDQPLSIGRRKLEQFAAVASMHFMTLSLACDASPPSSGDPARCHAVSTGVPDARAGLPSRACRAVCRLHYRRATEIQPCQGECTRASFHRDAKRHQIRPLLLCMPHCARRSHGGWQQESRN
jgi:hypothetical protein